VIATVIPLCQIRSNFGEALLQFGIKTVLLGILIAASFCAFAVYRNPIAYFLVSILVPATIGIFFRFQLSKSDLASTTAAFVSSILISGVLMAYGSYFQTFVEPSSGILIGGGWGSVLAAAFFGTITGAFCGLFSMLFYTIVRASVELYVDYRNNSC